MFVRPTYHPIVPLTLLGVLIVVVACGGSGSEGSTISGAGSHRAADSWSDRDSDGIYDADDQCVDAAEDVDGHQDTDGCPDLDNDSDDIADIDDLCPDDAEDMDEFEDVDGCPDIDNDGDRILDACDRCANEPETYNGFEDADGCADDGTLLYVERLPFEHVGAVISFASSSADLPQRALPLLDAIAQELQQRPYIQRIAIEGHADSQESRPGALSEARAKAVRDALIARGIEESRLVVEGFAARRPRDGRNTPESRATNRRSEFRLVYFTELPPLPAHLEYLEWRASIPAECPAAQEAPPAPRIHTPEPHPAPVD